MTEMIYNADDKRYDGMVYRRCGNSGLKLPVISLGLWHNFGGYDQLENGRAMLRRAFDLGVTHFDLANNYGPPPGSAEETFGKILREDFLPYRDEMIISTKAGYTMWPGPYGDYGSRKYLMASLDQSLKRMGLDYVDIFYHHRPDPDTPIEETMYALDAIVRQGKALYVGLSNYYDPDMLERAMKVLKELRTPCLIHQVKYSMFDRVIEDGALDTAYKEGAGTICFSPLAQGLLTDKYLQGIPDDSRASGRSIFLNKNNITEELLAKISKLNDIAASRGQDLAQMALSWVLRDEKVTSALIGASKVQQIEDNVKIAGHLSFTQDEISKIEALFSN